MVFAHQAAEATGKTDLRYPYGRDWAERLPMPATRYYSNARRPQWADLICDPTSGALRAMAQTVENGVNRTVAAVAILVIAGAIASVSWMAVQSYVAVSSLQTSVHDMGEQMREGFSDINKRLDDDRRGDGHGQQGP